MASRSLKIDFPTKSILSFNYVSNLPGATAIGPTAGATPCPATASATRPGPSSAAANPTAAVSGGHGAEESLRRCDLENQTIGITEIGSREINDRKVKTVR